MLIVTLVINITFILETSRKVKDPQKMGKNKSTCLHLYILLVSPILIICLHFKSETKIF